MVAGYAFSEGLGTTTADASGNGITGTLVGSPAWVASKNGTGLSFNGSSTYVNLGNPAALQFTGSITLSAWVRETGNVRDDGQIAAKSDSTSGWQLKSSPDTGPRTFAIGIHNASGISIQRYSKTVRALNTWYHVTGVYDATAQTLSIYVNGVLDNGILSGTVPSSQRASTVGANIGRRTGGYNILGIVDDVRIHGRALSTAEIQADMATPVGGAASDSTPPSAPTNLSGTGTTSSQVSLSWTASTDNIAVSGYRVERCQGAGCTTFTQIATPTATSFADSGLLGGTSYSYRVRATDAAANLGGYSNTASATTSSAADTTPPTAPSSLVSTATGITSTNLSWTASTDNIAVSGYRVECCQGAGCTIFTQIATPTATSFADSGLLGGTSYSYRVRAIDAAANLGAYSNTASATTAAVTGMLAGYSFSEGSGTATADASGNGVAGTLVNNPTWVAGKNGSGLSLNGSSTYVDLGNPAALQFTGSMTLSAWVFETGNVADDGQIVAQSDDISGWQLKSSPDTGLRTFAIGIHNASGISIQRYSNTVRALNTWYHVTGVYDATAQTLSIYVDGVLDNGILSGTVPSYQRASTVGANIGRRTGGYNILGTIDDVRIYGRALAAGEVQADMATPVGGIADATPPSAPTNLFATATSSSQVSLSWTASTDNVAVPGYRVERCLGAACTSFVQVATPTGTTFSDTGLVASNTYSYRVRATDAAANLSGYSNTASSTTSTLPVQFSLTVTRTGTGAGTVTSAPAGITCGSACTANYAQNTTVMLTAAAAAGSAFAGWSGSCTGTAASTSTLLNANATCTATFTATPTPQFSLTVSRTGTGSGTVASTPAGISCGSVCAFNFTQNTVVALNAAPATGSTFTGWSGSCAGTAATTTMTLTANSICVASFALGTATPGRADLAWDPVVSSAVTGYRAYYGIAPGVYLQAVGQGMSSGTATALGISGLTSGMRYYFVVTAVDTSNRESGVSNEVFKDIP